MYKVKRSLAPSEDDYAVVPLPSIRRSCHLFPIFPNEKISKSAAADWTSANVLDMCESFYINNFADMHTFQTIY